MRLNSSFALVALAAATAVAVPAAALAQQVVGYGPDGPIVLVAPDGRVLDRPPQYGVNVYFDRQGRRVLVDNSGDLVATEVPLRTLQRQRQPDFAPLPRETQYGNVQRLDMPPPDGTDRASLDEPGLETGAIPGQGDNGAAPLQDYPGSQAFPDAMGGELPTMPGKLSSKAHKADIAAVEVLLDRAGISPGVIDGAMGGNMKKALATYQKETGHWLDAANVADIKQRLMATGGPAFTEYTITPEDAAGPYVASIPTDYSKKAQLDRLGYTSTAEMLAERFHMDESYMKQVNPGVDFSVPGKTIKVANTGANATGQVAYIIADKRREQVRGYDASHRLLVAYPSTIGSTDTPSPSGTVTVERIAKNPEYTYNPKINFTQGNNKKILRIPPGPNGPVGNMWIALSKPTYGIHGTPDPSMIGKSNSHGCARLTNWDANELAKMLKPGVTVQFLD